MMVKMQSTINIIENNRNGDIPKFLKNISFLLLGVSLTQYHAKTVKNNLVTIAGTKCGFKNPIKALTTKDQTTNGL